MSIKRLSNNKYKIIVELGYDVLGNRRRKTETFIGTRNDAIKRQAELTSKYYHIGQANNLNELTFAEYSQIFIKKYCVESNVSLRTKKDYESMLKFILPLIGSVKLKKLSTYMLDTMYQKIKLGQKGKELSPKSMSHYYNLINVMLKQAKKWKFISVNPNEEAIKPKVPKKKKRFYESEEVEKLFQCLNNENIKTKALITLAIDSGARRSEICALRWSDVDFKNSTIFIDNSLKVIDGVVDEKNAKTEYSIRKVLLGQETMKILKEYKEWQDSCKNKLGEKWIDENRVFTAINGKHMHPDTTYKIFQKVIKKYDLPKLSFHELRHTCSSLLNGKKIDPVTIKERLGHSNISVTMDIYTHPLEENKKESARIFDRLQKTTCTS